MRRTSVYALFVVMVLGIAAMIAGAARPGVSVKRPRADSELAAQVGEQLGLSSSMPVRDLQIAVFNGSVQLNGLVNSPVERRKAAQTARQIEGVKQLTNSLRIDRHAFEALPAAGVKPIAQASAMRSMD